MTQWPKCWHGGQRAPKYLGCAAPPRRIYVQELGSAATGLASNEVHMGRLSRLPLTIGERTGVFGHQSLARDHLTYCDLALDRQ